MTPAIEQYMNRPVPSTSVLMNGADTTAGSILRRCSTSGSTAATGVADWLYLAAAPTFAIMALLTAVSGGGSPLCSMASASPLTGMVPTQEDSPHVPLTPEEIAADAEAVHRAGASTVHLHARDESGRPRTDATSTSGSWLRSASVARTSSSACRPAVACSRPSRSAPRCSS